MCVYVCVSLMILCFFVADRSPSSSTRLGQVEQCFLETIAKIYQYISIKYALEILDFTFFWMVFNLHIYVLEMCKRFSCWKGNQNLNDMERKSIIKEYFKSFIFNFSVLLKLSHPFWQQICSVTERIEKR